MHSALFFGLFSLLTAGSAWTPPERIGSGQRVSIAVDYTDRVHYTWWDNTTNTILYCSAARTTPTRCDSPGPITLPSAGESYYPTIAVDVAGRPHVTWETKVDSDEKYVVYYAAPANATTANDPGTWRLARVSEPSLAYSELPVVAVTPAFPPVVHVVFQIKQQDGNGAVMRTQSVDGVVFDPAVLVAPGYFPRVHIDARCCAHIVYNAPSPYGVYYVNQTNCRCTGGSGDYSRPSAISTSHREQTPDIATWQSGSGDTEAVVVWGDYSPGFWVSMALLRNGERVYMQRNVDGFLSYSLLPKISSSPDGRFLIGFQGKNSQRDTWGIFTIGFNATTHQFSSPSVVATAPGDQLQTAVPACRVSDSIVAFADTTTASIESSLS